MLNIKYSSSIVEKYWERFPSLRELFSQMHEVEEWVSLDILDEERIRVWLLSLTTDSLSRLHEKSKALIIVMFFIKTEQAIYVYQKLIEAEPSIERSLQMTANQMLVGDRLSQEPANVFWDRLRYIMLDNTIENVFSAEQLNQIKISIEHVNNSRGVLNET